MQLRLAALKFKQMTSDRKHKHFSVNTDVFLFFLFLVSGCSHFFWGFYSSSLGWYADVFVFYSAAHTYYLCQFEKPYLHNVIAEKKS